MRIDMDGASEEQRAADVSALAIGPLLRQPPSAEECALWAFVSRLPHSGQRCPAQAMLEACPA